MCLTTGPRPETIPYKRFINDFKQGGRKLTIYAVVCSGFHKPFRILFKYINLSSIK